MPVEASTARRDAFAMTHASLYISNSDILAGTTIASGGPSGLFGGALSAVRRWPSVVRLRSFFESFLDIGIELHQSVGHI